MATNVDERIARLNTASAGRVINPDEDEALRGFFGDGQIIADELLSVSGLDLDLSAEQRRTLSREEIASIATEGIRFEAVLTAGFAMQITTWDDITDPRVTYLLHEIGEESRHSRLFTRMVDQLEPQAHNPLATPLFRFLMKRSVRRIISLPCLLYTLVLGGEEIPDLFQKRAAEHPDTDPFLRAVNRYHRAEEARHLSFARTMLPELWASSNPIDRFAVRHVAPRIIRGMFDTLVHPGVYATVGLPAWPTWRAANRSAPRVALRHDATRPVLKALMEGGVISGRVPAGWRSLCGVNAEGMPA